jgi:hypothetical protein
MQNQRCEDVFEFVSYRNVVHKEPQFQETTETRSCMTDSLSELLEKKCSNLVQNMSQENRAQEYELVVKVNGNYYRGVITQNKFESVKFCPAELDKIFLKQDVSGIRKSFFEFFEIEKEKTLLVNIMIDTNTNIHKIQLNLCLIENFTNISRRASNRCNTSIANKMECEQVDYENFDHKFSETEIVSKSDNEVDSKDEQKSAASKVTSPEPTTPIETSDSGIYETNIF